MAVNKPKPEPESKRRVTIIVLAIGILLLFAIMFSQAAFNLTFLRPSTNEQTLILSGLSALIFLLLVALILVLSRILLKLWAERRGGVLGSKFRWRMVGGALMLSFFPVIFLFLFAYGLMNRSIDKWFSRPVEEVRQDTAAVASLLSTYVANDARNEAISIAKSPEARQAFQTGNFSFLMSGFHRHETNLRGGFAVAVVNGDAEAMFNAPDLWPVIKGKIPPQQELESEGPHPVTLNGQEYMVAMARAGDAGRILVALPLPEKFSTTLAQIKNSERRYLELSRERKAVRRTYMYLLLLLTVLVLFATTWFALFFSKFVTRPVAALASATEELSRGRFDYRVEVQAGDELGRLVQSFNHMAEELESSRRQIEASSRSLAGANEALEQRRRHMETILESIPTGVLSLDTERRVTHTNTALRRVFHEHGVDSAARFSVGSPLRDLFPSEVLGQFEHLLRKADRMGTATEQMEIVLSQVKLFVAVTVASLRVEQQRWGYVVVFEDLTGLLRAQKQAAWREVARRVAHEIKNPLTPIALSAERIQRHLSRGIPPDEASLAVISTCADTIAGAVETVRTLVNEFSALARFPSSRPEPSDLNAIVDNALSMFDGRLEGIVVRTDLASDLPKVMADPEAIRRVVANLVDNAAEAMQDALVREVHVSTALLKDTVEIVVADTGHGVTRELKEKLFMPYFSTKKRGTGLGLAIVNRIVEDHHGSIRVEENQPVGARFIVELPVAPEMAVHGSHA